MTAVTCILGPLSLPLPFSPVPITLTNFAVFLSIYILGMKYGTISLLIYLALGTIGLPVFSSFSGGSWEASRTDRGDICSVSSSLHSSMDFFMLRFHKKNVCFNHRHDSRHDCLLSIRNDMACTTYEPYFQSCPYDRSHPLSSRRCCQDRSRSNHRTETIKRNTKDTEMIIYFLNSLFIIFRILL